MVKSIFSVVILFLALHSHAQDSASKGLNFGIEQDVLPYLTGGYFAGLWAGKHHIRVRAITAKVNRPGFVIKKGFTHNRVTAYALLADYFIRENWKGWWVGTGLVYWQNSIQTKEQVSTSFYKTGLLNGSIGYNFKLAKTIYLSPWCGMHLKVAGDKHIPVADKLFTPALFNPEASIKLGIWL